MGRFSIRYPYFVVVCFLIISVIGLSSIVRMPVDLFPPIKIPVVVVATFYSGMPAEEIETSITGRFERFFTLGSGIDHIESKSLPGVSLIKIYFQPGTDADSAVTEITNLAMADLRKLPSGTLPPVVLKFDASSLPVCLITLKAQGLNEAQLRDMGQYNVRNQVASVPGASVPQPFGGRYRQIMVYVDPLKLEANQLSVMDVVRSVNEANLILPAGDVKIGPVDYSLFTNSQIDKVKDIDSIPLKTVNGSFVTVGDVGYAKDGSQIQYNTVRIDGQPSVYLPVLKQGGDSNTIAVVDGVKSALANLVDVPASLVAKVVFDQSIFVKNAIDNLVHEGTIGLVLTGAMILIFLGSPRGTIGTFLSIPLSIVTVFVVLYFGGSTINSMILGGLALAFSRVIDNSVIVLENIFRHLEEGATPQEAAEIGSREVALPVLAATLTTALVFFPVVFLFGVSRYLFTALAAAVVLSLFASYIVAMTILPLFCARFLKPHVAHGEGKPRGLGARFNHGFNAAFEAMLVRYDVLVARVLERPRASLAVLLAVSLGLCAILPLVQISYFPRTDPGQFVINLKAPSGTRLEDTTAMVAKVEDIVREIVSKDDLDVVVSNIGVTPGFSAIYTSNTASHSAFVQASLKEGHTVGSYEYMNRLRAALADRMPELTAYFQTGGLVDSVLNLGLPAPIDLQITGSNLERTYPLAVEMAKEIRAVPGVSDVFIPQDIDAPSLMLDVDRLHAGEMGLSEKEIVSGVITAVNSNMMIAPNYWVDPKSGNDYMLTVQYPESTVKTLGDLKAIPLRSPSALAPTRLDTVAAVKPILSPTLVSHYQLRRIIDIYVAPSGEDLGAISSAIDKIIAKTQMPRGVSVNIQGSVNAMHQSFSSFGTGLLMSVLLVYLVLVAQFRSAIDPAIILLAVPPGLAGVVMTLWLTGTSLNVMSLMGVVMLVGIAVSNSILIVEFAHRLWEEGRDVRQAVALSCRVRLRPVLMTSLATMIGLIPMALGLGEGSEAYAPLARVIIGGLAVSVIVTVFIVPAAFVIVHRRRDAIRAAAGVAGMRFTIMLAALMLAGTAPGIAAADPETLPQRLSLADAQAMALQNHPRIASEGYRAQASGETVTATKAELYPQIYGSANRVFTGSNTRVTAPPAGITDPTIIARGAAGVGISQLITDFGRQSDLISASEAALRSEQDQVQSVRDTVFFNATRAYYDVLRAQALLDVARQTIKSRSTLNEQVDTLRSAKLKSDLDASFARLGLDQANLLESKAQGNLDDAWAELAEALGLSAVQHFILTDLHGKAGPPAETRDAAIGLALSRNPELMARDAARDAAHAQADADAEAGLPVISAQGFAGVNPEREADQHLSHSYGAAGIFITIPIFTGGRLTAEERRSAYSAKAADRDVDAERNALTRDVQMAWDSAQTAYRNIAVTGQLLDSSGKALDLTHARYDIGSSSIVDVEQAEVAALEARIDQSNATYDYLIERAFLTFREGASVDLER